MMSKGSRIEYDKEANILFIRFSDEKSVDSDVQNNVVIDYAKDGSVVSVDIMGFSLDDFQQVPKELLATA